MIKIKTKAGSIELPKLTLKVSDLTDAVEAAGSTRESYEARLALLQEVIEADTLSELIDGEDLEEVDLVALCVLYEEVVSAYAAPVIEAQGKKLNNSLKAVQPALNAVQQVQAAQSRQGFKAVK